MKTSLIIIILLIQFMVFGQDSLIEHSKKNKYDFDIPWRAKSNNGIFDWFIEKLDSDSDSLLNEMFRSMNISTDSISWIYPTNLVYDLMANGSDYYSRRVFSANNKDKILKVSHMNRSENKLGCSLFELDYFFKDGVTTLVLIEYF